MIRQNLDFSEWMNERKRRVDSELKKKIMSLNISSVKFKEALIYAVTGGGKRLRPMLVFAASELGEPNYDVVQKACLAVELIHIYSLVHDDLPSMDNDSLRHGRATVHVKYDEATGILVGDGLQALSFDILSGPMDLPWSDQASMLKELASAAGPLGMVGGQFIDLDSVGKTLSFTELAFMQGLKTGALILAATKIGGICAGGLAESEQLALVDFAKLIGRAFQVVDDILDVTATTQVLGKTSGKDLRDKKPNFVESLGVTEAKRFAAELNQEAINHLTIFGDKANRLIELSNFVLTREF